MYEVMVGWESAHTLADQPPFMLDFAEIWQAADKIVYSKGRRPRRGAALRDSPGRRLCSPRHGGPNNCRKSAAQSGKTSYYS